jgi:glycine/D-amino acid oxidase-like deaminating enzyme
VRPYDLLVLGGGFYGAVIAAYARKLQPTWKVGVIERGTALLQRASTNNQARIHNGYHYPRSFTTAFRSRINLPRFVADWRHCVRTDVTMVYAIAQSLSKVTARQFERACAAVGAELQPASAAVRALFEPRRVQSIYQVEEHIFDAVKLAAQVHTDLQREGVDVLLQTHATALSRSGRHGLQVACETSAGTFACQAPRVFNCTYSQLNHFGGGFVPVAQPLKHEIAEMALVAVPEPLQNMGITVMDGPFFSLIPWPSRGLHTLSHVRYTPHRSWLDQPGRDPYAQLRATPPVSRADRMLRDAQRFVPSLAQARYVDSLYEVKTVLEKNEEDDGRPILLQEHPELPGLCSVLGGKIDNIYDILEMLRPRLLAPGAAARSRVRLDKEQIHA